jgi:hypothetical protein
MSRTHLPGLHIEGDGTVIVDREASLARLLACEVVDLSSEMVIFEDRQLVDQAGEERTALAHFLNSAREQVCNEGRLPPPRTELAPVGVQVEALHGGKPNPERRWAVGTVTSHEWCSVTRDWRVGVTFDQANGTWCGMPILGTSTFPDYIHVLGGPGRPWSSMTPTQINTWLASRHR